MSLSNITKVAIIRFAQSFHLYIHAYALILIDRGLSLFQITSIESIVIATIFFMEIPTGVIADRIGRKWSITAALVLMMSAEFLFLFARTYPVYIVVAILTGTGFAFASGAVEAMVYDSLPEATLVVHQEIGKISNSGTSVKERDSHLTKTDNRDNLMKKAMGQINSIARIAFFISPVVGAFIIGDGSQEGYIIAIALTVIALLIGVLVSLTLKEPQSEWDSEKPDSLTILKEGIAELRGNKNLQRLVLLKN